MLVVDLEDLAVAVVRAESAVLEVKEWDINKLELTENLEETQLPVQPEVVELHLLMLMVDMVETVVTVVSEELAELVVTAVHGVLLEALVRQVQPVALEQQELLVVLDSTWVVKLVQQRKILVPVVPVVMEETLVVAEVLVVLQAHT